MADFSKVKLTENEEIDASRTQRAELFRETNFSTSGHFGLAFSGGGIRSATFNLGILQGLAKFNLLQRVDYLSSVSGGGYISSWLISWIQRSGFCEVAKALASSPVTMPLAPPAEAPASGQPYTESAPVNFLRDYSNYLTPRVGIFGADTWASISSYLCNLLLNLTILVCILSAALLLPRIWESIVQTIAIWAHEIKNPAILNSFILYIWILAGALLLVSITMVTFNVASYSFPRLAARPVTTQKWVLILAVLPLFLAGALGSMGLWLSSRSVCQWGWVIWAVLGAAGYLTLRLLASFLSALLIFISGFATGGQWRKEFGDELVVWSWAPFAGLLGGILLRCVAMVFQNWADIYSKVSSPDNEGVRVVACLGTLMVVVVVLLTGILHLGLMGTAFKNEKREWWARAAGWLLIWCLGGAALFVLSLYAPVASTAMARWVGTKRTLLVGWIISTVGGLLAGKSGSTSGSSGNESKLEIAAKVAPYVFALGLMVLLALGLSNLAASHLLTGNFVHSQPIPTADAFHTVHFFGHFANRLTALQANVANLKALALGFAILLALALTLSLRVDVNEFSMQLYYRNRLIRCYLGASNPARQPQQFSGFDPNDDQKLANFSAASPAPPGLDGYAGPYPILNCTLNVTHGDRLAWQERKGESFFFSPRYCGFNYQEQRNSPDPKAFAASRCFRDTPQYGYEGGVYLGTAMAVSGAAASPNMGYHTSPPLAFLMTIFDVRLGWWMGNTQRETWRKAAPRCGLPYLMAELFALTNDRSKYVYLSDGGHFENLGLYELVRRHCKYIIVSDAGADPSHDFSDLANAIRKCRTDLGVTIDLNIDRLRLNNPVGLSQSHCAVGTIHYELVQPNLEPGKIVYIKSTLANNDPPDLISFRTQDPVFPHDSTLDQFFDESHFESYRTLGSVSIESILGPVGLPEKIRSMSTETIFSRI